MASIGTFPIKSIDRGVVAVAGSFRPNGVGAIDNTLNTGFSFTVARTGVGTFTITLDDSFPSVVAFLPHQQLNAVGDSQVQLKSISGKVITGRLVTGGAEADIASHANNVAHFILLVKNVT